MVVKKKISNEFYDVVDPVAEALDDIKGEARRVVETGIHIQDNFRQVAISLRRITRRTSMKMISSVLSFATPVDIEKLVEDVTTSSMTVHQFVKNSGLLPLFASRFRYFKYEEQDLSEFLDDLERARDIIADMEFDRIDMMYSIDVIKAVENLVSAMGGLKSRSITGAKAISKTGIKLKGIKGKFPKKAEKVETTKPVLEEQQADEIATSSSRIMERLTSIKEDWPEFKSAVDDLLTRLEPLLKELNEALGVKTDKR